VVRVSTREQAICAVDGIIAAGITTVEITLTVPGAIEIIAYLASKYGEKLLVGAGTVLTAAQCHAALLC